MFLFFNFLVFLFKIKRALFPLHFSETSVSKIANNIFII